MTDVFDLTACHFHEEGERGPWRVEHKDYVNSGFRDPTPTGSYTGLLHNGAIWMSDVPDEKREHYEAYLQAKRRGGRVLIHGLGLGMVVKAVCDLENVEHVDVVEIDADVIALCGPAFQPYVDAGKLTIHNDDCFTKKWPPGTRWQVVWHDIWQEICSDNLAEYAKLNRKFGGRADWQGAWAHDQLKWQAQFGW